MAYAVEWAAEAEEDLARLPALLASHVLDELDRLAADPVRLSRPSHFPYPIAQAFEFSRRHEAVTHYLTLLFRYRPDEQAIVIEGIGCMPTPPRP